MRLLEVALVVSVGILATAVPPRAQTAEPRYAGSPVHYDRPAPDNSVAALAAGIADGSIELERDPDHGLLPALLAALDVPASSQTLVFSKTSFQNDRIGPRSPRAIYFGDRAYVGYVPGSRILEATAVDPERGAVFYSITDDGDGSPVIRRDDAACLNCHAFAWNRGWPGHLVRSVFPSASGQPLQRLGSDVVDHDSPWDARWGGWFVTGAPPAMQHRGNAVWPDDANDPSPATAETLDPEHGFDPSRYPEATSDVVALMVLEHQTQVHNRIAWANYEATAALARQHEANAALDRPADHLGDATRDRLHELADELLGALLFRDEPPLPAPIPSGSRFVADFAARGPRDDAGRSLREFDLETRLFRWPLSYVIQGDAFRRLHPAIRDVVLLRLERILSGRFGRRTYRHLSPDDRATILEIVRATVPDLPEDF